MSTINYAKKKERKIVEIKYDGRYKKESVSRVDGEGCKICVTFHKFKNVVVSSIRSRARRKYFWMVAMGRARQAAVG